MNIYELTDYRQVIRLRAKELGLAHLKLATAARVHPSYFSRVMVESADFTDDQCFAIGRELLFADEELEYFLLLRSLASAGTTVRKQYLQNKLNLLRDEKLKIVHSIAQRARLNEERVALFYKDILYTKVYVLVTALEFQRDPKRMIGLLGVPWPRIRRILEYLAQLDLLVLDPDTFEVKAINSVIHLDPDHPLSVRNHMDWRIDVLRFLQLQEKRGDGHHLSVALAINDAAFEKIKERLRAFILEAQAITAEVSGQEKLRVFLLDLY